MARGSSRLRVTPMGARLLASCVVLVAIGLVSGYVEFVVVGTAGLLLAAVAVVWPRMASSVTFERIEVPHLVCRGDDLTLTISARSTRVSSPTTVIDQLAGSAIPIRLPSLRPDVPILVRYRMRALRRGVHELGPLLEERTDPLQIITRTRPKDVVSEVLVHPVVHDLSVRDGVRRRQQSQSRVSNISDDPLADFRSLREYVPGDDERLVHWPTVARTGTLMVRDHFELRRTTRSIYLETLGSSIAPVAFEEMVEIAASIVCESLAVGFGSLVRTRDKANPGPRTPIRHRAQALELFSRVTLTDEAQTLTTAQLGIGRDLSDEVVLVAGGASPLITQFANSRSVARRLVVVRLVDRPGQYARLPVECVDVNGAFEFVRAWRSRGAGR